MPAVSRQLAILLVLLATLCSGAATAAAGTVTVRAGDTLGAIAARHGTTVRALAAANGIANPDAIAVGRSLTIPGGAGAGASPSPRASPAYGGRYTVKPGDNLAAIAARHGTTVGSLARLNNIADPNAIAVGAVLRVPAGAGSSTASPAQVAAAISRRAAQYGVDPQLARAIAWQESGFNQGVVSSTGAVGVMQLMPETARWVSRVLVGRPLNRRSVSDNIEGGVAYLAWLTRRAPNTRTAVGAYYQGLRSLVKRGPYLDTTAYVNSVMALYGQV